MNSSRRTVYCLALIFVAASTTLISISWQAAAPDPTARGKSPSAGGLRIVSLSPSVTEMLFLLGLNESVVGVTDHCDYPPEARRIERVGGLGKPSLEKLLSLAPDLIVGAGAERNDVLQALRKSGDSGAQGQDRQHRRDVWGVAANWRCRGQTPRGRRGGRSHASGTSEDRLADSGCGRDPASARIHRIVGRSAYDRGRRLLSGRCSFASGRRQCGPPADSTACAHQRREGDRVESGRACHRPHETGRKLDVASCRPDRLVRHRRREAGKGFLRHPGRSPPASRAAFDRGGEGLGPTPSCGQPERRHAMTKVDRRP